MQVSDASTHLTCVDRKMDMSTLPVPWGSLPTPPPADTRYARRHISVHGYTTLEGEGTLYPQASVSQVWGRREGRKRRKGRRMLSTTQLYTLGSLLLLSQAAIIPETPLAAISANLEIPSIHQNAIANLGVDLNLGAMRIMTRSLPEHNCFLKIQYYTHLRLPQPWQLVFARA